ncbi:MAG: apolipoprotein N-acyltransferase [Kordiimonadaceae bacterium]|nr:apolipoprotein N-acyltransferase [Kordiimonadaceae bacterium]
MADQLEATMPAVSLSDQLVNGLFNWVESRSRFGLSVLAFVLGALLSQAFAPTNFFPAVFIALPVALLMLDRARIGKQAFAHGWWFGFGFFAVGLSWIAYSFTQQQNVPAALAPFAVLALAAIMAVFPALAFWTTWRLKVGSVAKVCIFAAAWTLFEIARGFLFTGFPWHLLGAVWAEWLPVAQTAYWITVYGLSFLTIVSASAFVLFLQLRPSLPTAAFALTAFAVFPVLALLGNARLEENQTNFHLGISLRLVQANVQQDEKWRSHLIDDHFETHMRLSRSGSNSKGGKAEGIKLLIWPETAVQKETFDREGSLLRWRVSRLLEFGAYAITGAPRYNSEDSELKYYNSLLAFNAKGKMYARYDKNHLVPFGEYLPLAPLLKSIGLSQLAELAGGSGWTRGNGLQTVTLPGIPKFSPLICYEAIFPGQVILPQERPEWMLVLSNDAWFGMTDGPYQHLALSRMRAIEEGLPMVRSTSTGVCAVIDSYGRTQSALGLGRQGTVESPLPKSISAPAWPTGLRVFAVLMLSIGILSVALIAMVVRARRGNS